MVLLLVEVVFLAMVLTADGTGHVVAGVTDALELGNLTEHGADLRLRFVGEVGIADLIEVVCNLKLHVIGDVLVLFNAVIKLGKLLLVLLHQELTHHPEHALHPL